MNFDNKLNEGKYTITNAAESLLKYVEPFIHNRDMLLDHSGVLGYAISSDVERKVTADKSVDACLFLKLCLARREYIGDEANIGDIISWARAVGRTPIVIYDATMLVESKIDLFSAYSDNILVLSSKTKLLSPAEIYYTNNVIDVPNKLLISFTGMIFGQRLAWAEQFEKIIYYKTLNLKPK